MLNFTHYPIMRTSNKQERQRFVFNYSSDIDFKDFMNVYNICAAKPFSYLVNDTTLDSYNLLRFRNNL